MTAESSNNEDKIIDSRVSFEYHVTPDPIKIDGSGNKWYKFKLLIAPKDEFDLKNIEKVVYLLPSTFDPQNIASTDFQKNFAIELDSLGGFYVQAIILFTNNKEKLKLTQYLPTGKVVTDPSTKLTNPAEYWTDFAMKQAQYWTKFGS